MLGRFLQKHLIPHEKNDFRPHALQQTAVVGMMILILISFAVANFQSIFWMSSNWLVSTILPAVIFADTNEERADQLLLPLNRNPILDAAAEAKAKDMAAHEYFSHYGPNGRSPWYWLSQAGYDFTYAGENLAVHFTDSSALVEAWMESPTHRDNILNTDYQEIGIGTARGHYEGFDTIFVVQLFGTSAEAAESVANFEVFEPASDTGTYTDEEAPVEVAGVSTAVFGEDSGLTEDGTIYYSSYLATAGHDGQPASGLNLAEGIDISGAEARLTDTRVNESTLPVLAAATKPQLILQMAYIAIGLFVFFALLLSIVVEVKKQEPVQVVYGTGLIIVMLLLFYIHVAVTNNIVIA